MQRTGRADWTLMIAIHEALRRDLDQLLNTTASHASARARWRAFRHQLCFHLAAEHAAMCPRVRAQLADDPPGQACWSSQASMSWVRPGCRRAHRLVRERSPDLVVVDIRMPPGHSTEGLEATRVIRAEFPQIAILVLSAHAEVEHAMELLASGHSIGCLLKSRVTDVAEFVDALDRIARGGSVVDPALVQELVAARRRDDPLDALSPGSVRCLRSWPRADRMPVSPGSSGSPKEPSKARAQHLDEAAHSRDQR
jgi:CheY-like chemotaxis protein